MIAASLRSRRRGHRDQELPPGVAAAGAFADILVVDGDPLADLSVLQDPARLRLILRGGEVMKTTLT